MRVSSFVDRDPPADGRSTAEVQPGERPHNICGVLVHVLPAMRQAVTESLVRLPGVEVHHAGDDGKFIVIVEDTAASRAGPVIESFSSIGGIVSVALVFHHFDTDRQGDTGP